MLKNNLIIAMSFLVMVTGCSDIVPISKVALPPVTVIRGNIEKIESASIIIKDDSENITVAYPNGSIKPVLPLGGEIIVYGNLRPGTPKIFDAYVIRSESETTILQQPGGHIGFVLQTEFK